MTSKTRFGREVQALAEHARHRGNDTQAWPLAAAESIGLSVGAAVAAGVLTPEEASDQIDALAAWMRSTAGLPAAPGREWDPVQHIVTAGYSDRKFSAILRT